MTALPPPPGDCFEYMSQAMIDRYNDLKKAIEVHTEEEMDRYDQIIGKIDTNDRNSNDRHDETQRRLDNLMQSIEAYMVENADVMSGIKRAFPKDDEGRPDYDGHRGAHLSWIEDGKDSKELKKYIRNVVLGAAAVAVTSWITLLLWQGILSGPK